MEAVDIEHEAVVNNEGVVCVEDVVVEQYAAHTPLVPCCKRAAAASARASSFFGASGWMVASS